MGNVMEKKRPQRKEVLTVPRPHDEEARAARAARTAGGRPAPAQAAPDGPVKVRGFRAMLGVAARQMGATLPAQAAGPGV